MRVGREQQANRRSAFMVCLLISALATLDISKVNVAIPAIEQALDAEPTAVQLIVAGYVFAFGISLIPSGRFGDLRSRRSMFITGMLAFGVASIACALAPSVELLVAGRGLQGLAAGMIVPQTLGIIQQLFTGEERGRAFGVYGAMVGLTVAIGPPLGGALVTVGGPVWGWRMVFLVNLPILLICLPLALKYLPRHQHASGVARSLDPVGIVLLAMTTAAFMLPFVLTTGTGVDDPRRWLLIPAAVVVGALFALWERGYKRRGRTPVLDVELLRIPPFRHGALIALFYYGGGPAALLATTLFFQHALGMDALQAGAALVPFALVYVATATWSGRSTHRYGRRLVVAGLAISLLGWGSSTLVAVLVAPELAAVLIPLTLMLSGGGAGMIAAPNQTLMLREVPQRQGGLAGSIAQMAQRLGAAMGVAVAMALFYGTLSSERLEVSRHLAYQDSFRNAILGSMVLMLMAAIAAIADEVWRRKHAVVVVPPVSDVMLDQRGEYQL
jgi:MFS family permease